MELICSRFKFLGDCSNWPVISLGISGISGIIGNLIDEQRELPSPMILELVVLFDLLLLVVRLLVMLDVCDIADLKSSMSLQDDLNLFVTFLFSFKIVSSSRLCRKKSFPSFDVFSNVFKDAAHTGGWGKDKEIPLTQRI